VIQNTYPAHRSFYRGTVNREYDGNGCLSRVSDSEGHVEVYTYGDRARMLTVGDEKGDTSILRNQYDVTGYIEMQTMADGERFQYHYVRESEGPARGKVVPDLITHPRGLVTYLRYGRGGHIESLPRRQPQ
jgi:hypothetical protein